MIEPSQAEEPTSFSRSKDVRSWHHPVGIIISLAVFVTVNDEVVGESLTIRALGPNWQALTYAFAPTACVILFLLISLVPVGNKSRVAIIRSIGRLGALHRYLLFVASIIVISTTLHFVLVHP
jgi:hypothetical protein